MSAETPREVVTRLAKAPTDPGLTAIAHALLDLADAVREATGKLDGFRTAWCPGHGGDLCDCDGPKAWADRVDRDGAVAS